MKKISWLAPIAIIGGTLYKSSKKRNPFWNGSLTKEWIFNDYPEVREYYIKHPSEPISYETLKRICPRLTNEYNRFGMKK